MDIPVLDRPERKLPVPSTFKFELNIKSNTNKKDFNCIFFQSITVMSDINSFFS